jgi:hypothetical protein
MKIDYKGKIKGDMIKMKFKTETPGGSRGSGRRVTHMSAGGAMGGSGGAFSGGFGGSLGIYGPRSFNEFTLERVSDEPVNPVN